jgi:sulfite oxidase
MAHSIPVSDSKPMEVKNRPDEWKIEQGMSGAKLPFLDQTGQIQAEILPRAWPKLTKDESAIKAVGDPNTLFKRERKGWKG